MIVGIIRSWPDVFHCLACSEREERMMKEIICRWPHIYFTVLLAVPEMKMEQVLHQC